MYLFSHHKNNPFPFPTTANKVFTDNSDALINVETRGIPVMKKGVYFAFQDQGACATLLAVRVYYVACPQVVENLAYFEETAAG